MKSIKINLNEELESFKGQIIDIIIETFDNQGQVAPVMFALVEHNNKLNVALLSGLAEFFVDEKSKDIAAHVIRDFTKEIKPIAIAFATEAYMSHEMKDVSSDSNKKEIVMINFETYDKESSVILEISRKKDDVRLIPYEDIEWRSKSKDTDSRFSNLLVENYSELAQWVSKQLEDKHNWN